MNTHKIGVALLGLTLALSTTLSLSSSGCSSTPNNQPDASHFPDGASGSGGTAGSGTKGRGGSSGSGGASGSGGTAGDSGLPDTGTCKSDSSSCNSCYTDAQAGADPYNACSPYTKNCLKFSGSVPSHPTL